MELFTLYLPNILAALAAALALSILGGLLAARRESLQAFVVSQSAALGITVGMALSLLVMGSVDSLPLVPSTIAFVCAISVYFLSQKLCNKHRVKTTEILVVIFLFTIAVNYLLTTALPALEQHFSTAFMGDIATASAHMSHWLLLISLLSISFFLYAYKKLLFQSFWVFNSGITFYPKLQICLYIVGALLIVESTRIFGFLFTVSSLISLPLGASLGSKSLRAYNKSIFLLAPLMTLIGFLLSLKYQMLSTSASIVLMHIVGAAMLMLLSRTKN